MREAGIGASQDAHISGCVMSSGQSPGACRDLGLAELAKHLSTGTAAEPKPTALQTCRVVPTMSTGCPLGKQGQNRPGCHLGAQEQAAPTRGLGVLLTHTQHPLVSRGLAT